ncbi:unnamed protein product [Parajaminaea phylloscopi]
MDSAPQPSRIAPDAVPQGSNPRTSATPASGTDGGNGTGITSSVQRLTAGKVPCARSSLLTGIATAGGITAIGLVTGRTMRHATRWGGAAFIVVSLASWETCRRGRIAEATRMKTIIEQHNRKVTTASAP